MKCWPLPGVSAEVLEPPHPGSFGAVRKFDVHCGIDLYCPDGSLVVAVESGTVVAVEKYYTGPNSEPPSPWWFETQAVLVEGESGVICYGEVDTDLNRGQVVTSGDKIGRVKRVLKKDKGKPTSMLHFELYRMGIRESGIWNHDPEEMTGQWCLPGIGKPSGLLDPTELLKEAQDREARQ